MTALTWVQAVRAWSYGLAILLPACSPSTGSDRGPGLDPSAGGSLTIRVLDDSSRSPVEGASVEILPAGIARTSDANGDVQVRLLPAGSYQVTARAPSLRLSGRDVVTGPAVAANVDGVAVTAGGSARKVLRIPRIETGINLVEVHAGGPAPAPTFTDRNCIACHGSRRRETSGDPKVKPFHAIMVEQVSARGLGGCTFCHVTVDIAASSGASLGKQVDVKAICTRCHPGYPRSFEAQPAAAAPGGAP